MAGQPAASRPGNGATAPPTGAAPAVDISGGVITDLGTPAPLEAAADFNRDGLLRDERGIRVAPESED